MRKSDPHGHAFGQVVDGHRHDEQPYALAAVMAGATGASFVVFMGRERVQPQHQQDAQAHAQHYQASPRECMTRQLGARFDAGQQERKSRSGQHHACGHAQHRVFVLGF